MIEVSDCAEAVNAPDARVVRSRCRALTLFFITSQVDSRTKKNGSKVLSPGCLQAVFAETSCLRGVSSELLGDRKR